MGWQTLCILCREKRDVILLHTFQIDLTLFSLIMKVEAVRWLKLSCIHNLYLLLHIDLRKKWVNLTRFQWILPKYVMLQSKKLNLVLIIWYFYLLRILNTRLYIVQKWCFLTSWMTIRLGILVALTAAPTFIHIFTYKKIKGR